jgi:hypothetical protein
MIIHKLTNKLVYYYQFLIYIIIFKLFLKLKKNLIFFLKLIWESTNFQKEYKTVL